MTHLKKKSSNQYFPTKICIQTTIKLPLRFHFELHFKTVRKECLLSHNDRYWGICSNYFVSERPMEKTQTVLEMLVYLPLNHLTWLLSHCIGYLSEPPSTCWKVPYIPLYITLSTHDQSDLQSGVGRNDPIHT